MRAERVQSGYSLIEALVALTVLALTLTVLMRIFGGGLRNIDLAAQYTDAVVIAEAQLAAVGTLVPVVPGTSDGEHADRYHWTRTIAEYPSADLIADAATSDWTAYRVVVDVEWQNLSRTRTVQLATLKLGPRR